MAVWMSGCGLSGHLFFRVIAEECDDNYLLADVLIVLKQLVKYGYYDDAKDVDTVMKPLTKILSGFHDELFSKKEHKKTGGMCVCVRACMPVYVCTCAWVYAYMCVCAFVCEW